MRLTTQEVVRKSVYDAVGKSKQRKYETSFIVANRERCKSKRHLSLGALKRQRARYRAFEPEEILEFNLSVMEDGATMLETKQERKGDGA